MTTDRMPAGRDFPDTEADVLKRHMICETGNGWQPATTVFMCLFLCKLLTLIREIRKIYMCCMIGWVSVSEPAVTKNRCQRTNDFDNVLKMQNTDFELPLSESDLRELVNYIKERCQSHKMP